MTEKTDSSTAASDLWLSIKPEELLAYFPGDQQSLKSNSTVESKLIAVVAD